MAVVVYRIEPRKGDAGEIFRNFMELEYILKILNIYRQYRIIDRVGIEDWLKLNEPKWIRDDNNNKELSLQCD